MTTFDGTTAPEAQPWSPQPAQPAQPEPQDAAAPAPEMFKPDSLLDQLRAEVSQRDVETSEPWRFRVKGTNFRLVCETDIANDDYQRWMKASLPRQKGRRGGAPSVADMDQLQLSARAIIGSNLGLEVLASGTVDTWRPLTAPGGGDMLAIDSPEILGLFNVMDPIEALRKLFGRDAALIDAGQKLLEAAGYLGDDDEAADPTVPVRSAASVKKG